MLFEKPDQLSGSLLDRIGGATQTVMKPPPHEDEYWYQRQDNDREPVIQHQHRAYHERECRNHAQQSGKDFTAESRHLVDIHLQTMQRIAGGRVVVILSRKTLQVTQQRQPAPVSHLLHGAEIQYSAKTIEAEPAQVSEKESRRRKRQPTHAPVRNNFVDQIPDDKGIQKDQNAGRHHTE